MGISTLDNYVIEECVETVRKCAPHLRRTLDPDCTRLLDSMRDNLLAAFEHLKGLTKAEYAVGLWRYCAHRGLFREALDMIAESRALSKVFPYDIRLQANIANGFLCKRLSRYTQAEQSLNLALKIARFIDQPCEQTFILLHLCQVHHLQGDLDKAMQVAHECLDLSEKHDDQWTLAGVQNEIGVIHLFGCEYAEADKYFAQALAIWETTGEHRRGLEIMINRAFIAGEQGNFFLAEQYYRQAFKVCRVLNDPRFEALCLHNLGDICIYTEKLLEARRHLTPSFKQNQEIGHLCGLTYTIRAMGMVLFREGNYKQSIRFISFAEHYQRGLGSTPTKQELCEPEKAMATMRSEMRANIISMYWNQGKRISLHDILPTFVSTI